MKSDSLLIQELTETRTALRKLILELKKALPAIHAGAALPADDLLQAMIDAEHKLVDSSH